jgi:purine-nucleoside phosphorylase
VIAITFALPTESSGLRDKIDNKNVTIFHTGVGRQRCEHVIATFLDATRPRLLISSGFAGGLSGSLMVGDVIAAENFSDGKLLSKSDARRVKLFTASAIVEDRQAIAHKHGADAVDMETEVIAHACAARSIPMLSLRVISDTAREPFPAPMSILFDIARQRPNYSRLFFYLLRNPARIARLIRFSRQISRARDRLTNAIVDLLRRLDVNQDVGDA